jgi:hypothetical protein
VNGSIVVLPSGQRVRLTPGRHGSLGEGACVVELASILAAEPFSDRPRCVDPVIASYLRAWNDRVAYVDRQRLAPYATRIVDSRAPGDVRRRRRDLCLAACGGNVSGGRVRRTLSRLAMRARIAVFVGWVEALRLDEGAGEFAARVLIGRRDLDSAFYLLEQLLDVGRPSPATNGAGSRSNGWVSRNGASNGYPSSANGTGHVNGDAPVNGAESQDVLSRRPAAGSRGTAGP